MPVLEYPTQRDNLLAPGSFVVIELDPVASIDAFADEIAISAASRLETQKRFALVRSPNEWFIRAPLQRYHFDLLGRGHSDPAWAALPIHPAEANCEGSRRAVLPTNPLPFQDMFISTEHKLEATISKLHVDTSQVIQLPDSELCDFHRCRIRDARRLRQLRWDAENEIWSDDGDDAWSDVSSSPTAPILCIHREPYVRVWRDLDVAAEPGQPESLQKELYALRRIQREWYEREKRDLAAKSSDRVQEWLLQLERHQPDDPTALTSWERASEDSQSLQSEPPTHWGTLPFGDKNFDWVNEYHDILG